LVELLQKHAEREGKHKAPMKTMRNMKPFMAHSARLATVVGNGEALSVSGKPLIEPQQAGHDLYNVHPKRA
jgi:hypothetical protein